MNYALLTTLFASSLALLGLTLGKDNKVSEFRQQWIDGLREDVSEFLANVQHVWAASIGHISREAPTDALLKVNELSSRIRLRLDPCKPESKNLIAKMKELRDLVCTSGTTEPEMMLSAHAVEDTTIPLLERAWKKVQSGERSYRICRWLSIAGLVLSVVLLARGFTLRTPH